MFKDPQLFRVGDIVQHQEDRTCFICTFAEPTRTLSSGATPSFQFWAYLFQPIGFGDGTPYRCESYEEEPMQCPECRKRAFLLENLDLLLRTNLDGNQLEEITF